MSTRPRIRWLRGLVAFAGVGGIALPVLYFAAITIAPPITSDGHPVMPIGQVMFASVFAPLLGFVAAYFAGRRVMD